MATERTPAGREIEAALGEVLAHAHVRRGIELPCRIVDDPCAERILAVRSREHPHGDPLPP